MVRPSTRSPTAPAAVSIRMRAAAPPSARVRQTWSPWTSGRSRSSTITSYRLTVAFSSASAPSRLTSTAMPSWRRPRAIAAASTPSSSTTSTRTPTPSGTAADTLDRSPSHEPDFVVGTGSGRPAGPPCSGRCNRGVSALGRGSRWVSRLGVQVRVRHEAEGLLEGGLLLERAGARDHRGAEVADLVDDLVQALPDDEAGPVDQRQDGVGVGLGTLDQVAVEGHGAPVEAGHHDHRVSSSPVRGDGSRRHPRDRQARSRPEASGQAQAPPSSPVRSTTVTTRGDPSTAKASRLTRSPGKVAAGEPSSAISGRDSRDGPGSSALTLPPVMLATSPMASASSAPSRGSRSSIAVAMRTASSRSQVTLTVPCHAPLILTIPTRRAPPGPGSAGGAAGCTLSPRSSAKMLSTIMVMSPSSTWATGAIPMPPPYPAGDRPLGLDVEVDEHVAQQHQVHPRQRRPGRVQVERAELHRPAQAGHHPPVHALLGEVLDEHGGRQPAVDLELAVAALPGAGEHRGRQVGRQDADLPPGQLAEVLGQEHRQAVGLLAARAGGRPDVQATLAPAPLDQAGQDLLAQRLPERRVAEEQRLVGGDRLDHLGVQRAVAEAAELGDQVGHGAHALLAHQPGQPRLDQVLLAGLQHDGRLLPHQPAQVVELEGGHAHVPCSPPSSGSAARGRPGVSTRWRSSAARRSSGTTWSAMPASATSPGMPQTTELALSCASTWPPAARSTALPCTPSRPMPVSTTPSAPPP